MDYITFSVDIFLEEIMQIANDKKFQRKKDKTNGNLTQNKVR